MKWKKFTVKTITDAEDIIISTLYDIGLEGAQIEDKVPGFQLEGLLRKNAVKNGRVLDMKMYALVKEDAE